MFIVVLNLHLHILGDVSCKDAFLLVYITCWSYILYYSISQAPFFNFILSMLYSINISKLNMYFVFKRLSISRARNEA